MNVSLSFEMDLNGAGRELDRLRRGPAIDDILRLESTLADLFAETQAVVHIITGSLKLSGKVESESARNHWLGEISYGGQSAGVHNPVRYAQLERARGPQDGPPGTDEHGRTSGMHDFMAPTYGRDREFEQAVLGYLRGGAV